MEVHALEHVAAFERRKTVPIVQQGALKPRERDRLRPRVFLFDGLKAHQIAKLGKQEIQ